MKIRQFKFSADNFGYLVWAKKNAIAIDGGAPEQMAAFAEKHNLNIVYVSNTHSHHDHTPGNKALLDLTGAEFIDCRNIASDQDILLDSEILQAIPTPGHTSDSVSFLASGFMVTGDTLFNGTVGNCFSGDLDAFFYSLKRLLSLPPSTRIYAGHDYVHESMQEARQIEPGNSEIEKYLDDYDPDNVVSTVEQELLVNPYVRFNAPEIIAGLSEGNMPVDTELARFKSVMQLY